ncbi:MAG: LysR family transcriptional regulator [Leucobacter sp.]
MLEMKRLRLLWELSARGTIAAVAEALSYSPSAVSQQLAILEKEAGVPLLRRAGRTLELTPAGAALVSEIEELLDGLERADAVLHREHDQVVGTVRIAVFQTVLLAYMPQVLQRLRREHPRLRLELVEYEPEDALRETWLRSFDLVIAEKYPDYIPRHFEGLERVSVVSDPLRLALPLPMLGGSGADDGPADANEELRMRIDRVQRLEDAAGLPWVVELKGTASRHFLVQACRAVGFEPDIRYETPDLSAHVRLIETGNAVGILPELVGLGIRHRLRFVELEDRPERVIFTAARTASEGHASIAAVRSAIAAEARRLHSRAEHLLR